MALCSWLLRSSTKNCCGEEGEQNTNQRTRDGKPEGNTPAGLLSGGICLHAIFSSVRRSTFHVARNFFPNVERTQENLDRRVWTRGFGENAAWLRPHHDFSRRQRKPPISSKQNCDTFRFVSFETKPLRCPRSRLKAGSPRSATGRTTRAGPLSNRALRVAWKAGRLRTAKVLRALYSHCPDST